MNSLASALTDLREIFEECEVPFLIGGSVASSVHGLPRQTNDVDIVAGLTLANVQEFCDAARAKFYVDLADARRAVEAVRGFNVLHLQEAFKFDIFPAATEAFLWSELRRGSLARAPGLEPLEVPICSPEDTLLAKLAWFRKTGETSDRQWSDVVAIVKVQQDRLDQGYLRHWAEHLGITDLLNRVLV